MSRPLRVTLACVAVLAVAAVAFWAGRVTLTAPEVAAQAPDSSLVVEVIEQEIGRSITVSTTVRRSESPLALNSLSGVVTSVASSGAHGQGAVLYRVGDVPVVLVAGATPFWRDLGDGAEGDDVRQVQQALADAGLLTDVDGVWDAPTTRAVQEWQSSWGAPRTGSLPLGTVVASPEVPVGLTLDAEVAWPGAVLAGGEAVVSAATGAPTFVMEVTQQQAETIPTGTGVLVHGVGAQWPGVIGSSAVVDGGVELEVTAPDGGSLCADTCEAVPAEGEAYLLTDVRIVPSVTGPVVPVSALRTEPDGTTTVMVVENDGDRRVEVSVVTIADGLAVVDGVAPGDSVRVFGDATPDAPTSEGSDPDPTESSG